jgi:Holliday junction resolvase RusA-like endonuclease
MVRARMIAEPITVILLGEPRGKGRPRFTRNGHPYTPAKTRAYEREMAQAGKAAMRGREPLTGPLNVAVTAIMGVPPSWSAKKRDAALVGAIWPTGRPDADNCQKAAFDSLNGICWRDDSQIVRATIEKRYGEEPLIKIEIKLVDIFPLKADIYQGAPNGV